MVRNHTRPNAWARALVSAACVGVVMRAQPGRAADPPRAEEWQPETASLETLVQHAIRNADAEARRTRKAMARRELFARGAETLRFLMEHAHVRKISLHVLLDNVVNRLPDERRTLVLVSFLDSEHARTRKVAAYYLGFCDAPEHAPLVLPLVDDEKAGTAAIRTLGQWRVTNTVARMSRFLADADERRRVAAANALRDIGDPRAIPHLIRALDDAFFTVRNTAERALAGMGPQTESALLIALEKAHPPALRHLIRVLGVVGTDKAVKPLEELLAHPDWGVRGDAAFALSRIDPMGTEDALERLLVRESNPYVRRRLLP